MPPDAKYNLLPNTLLNIFGLAAFVLFLKNTQQKYFVKYTVIVIVALCSLRPMFAAKPVYLNYMSLFRNTNSENTDFLDMNINCGWTWIGWGETNYFCIKYIEQNSTGNQKVLIDYYPPFESDKRITVETKLGMLYKRDFNNDMLKYFLQDLLSRNINYLQISKNVAFRDGMANLVIKNYTKSAQYVHSVCGVDYGWVFDIKKLQKDVGGESAMYFLNKCSELFNQKKFTESVEMCNKVLMIDSANFDAYVNLCASHANLKNWEAAYFAAKKAIEINPNSQQAQNNLQVVESNLIAK